MQKQIIIVKPAKMNCGEHRTAVLLRRFLNNTEGVNAEVVTAPAEGQIYLGKELTPTLLARGIHGFAIAGNEKRLAVVANSAYGYEAAQEALFKLLENGFPAGEISIYGNGNTKLTAGTAKTGEVRIFSNNLWGNGKISPEQRADMLFSVYNAYRPEVFGFQEFHNGVRGIITGPLKKAGYREVSFDLPSINDGSSVNSTPIFYNPRKLELLQKGYYWYFDIDFTRPEIAPLLEGYEPMAVRERMRISKSTVRYDYSKGFSYGIFKVKKTGHVFLAASTHLWWMNVCPEDGICRKVQIAVAKDKLLGIAADFLKKQGLEGKAQLPIFLMGDFNLTQHFPEYQNIVTNTISPSGENPENAFVWLNDLAPVDERQSGTSNHHREGHYNEQEDIFEDPCIETHGADYSIDYIFTDPATAQSDLTVHGYKRVSDLIITLATDHCPLFTDITFGEDAAKL